MPGYDRRAMLRLILAMIAAALTCVPIVLVSGGNYYVILLLSPLTGVVAALIAPEVFLNGHYPRLRRRR
jgi:hypothetical protein